MKMGMHDSDEESSNVEARLVIRVVEDKLTKNRVEWILYKTSLQKIATSPLQSYSRLVQNPFQRGSSPRRFREKQESSVEIDRIIDYYRF